MTSVGLNFDEIDELRRIADDYVYKKNNASVGITFSENGDIDKRNRKCYNTQKEEKNMSFMALVYDGLNTYLGTDSRITFSDGSFNNNFQKLFIKEDKTMAIASTGLATKNISGETINFPQELSLLCFSGLNIYEALNTTRKDSKTYFELLENDCIFFFIARQNDFPIICDIKDGKIGITLLKNVKQIIYVNGGYDNNKAIDKIKELLEYGYFPEDAIKKVINDIIEETNKTNVLTIGGKANVVCI